MKYSGYVDPRFAPVAAYFGRLFDGRRGGGGALSIRLRGHPVVDIWTGFADPRGKQPWAKNTLALAFSATKGAAATVIHRLADRGLIEYDAPVAEYWPAFSAKNKGRITVRQVLSHQAGLHKLEGLASNVTELFDHLLMEERLAGAAADDACLGRPGYHAFTVGWLLAGLARHVTGRGMAELFKTELAGPLGIDGLYLGAPEKTHHRIATPMGVLSRPYLPAPLESRLRKTGMFRHLMNAIYVPGVESLIRLRALFHTEMAAANGFFTADALARLYEPLSNHGKAGDVQLLSPQTVHELQQVQTRARDDVMVGVRAHWRLGYHRTVTIGRSSHQAFGHYGFGGPGGWADPASGLSFGFVTNHLGWITTPIGDHRTFRLSGLALECARQLQ